MSISGTLKAGCVPGLTGRRVAAQEGPGPWGCHRDCSAAGPARNPVPAVRAMRLRIHGQEIAADHVQGLVIEGPMPLICGAAACEPVIDLSEGPAERLPCRVARVEEAQRLARAVKSVFGKVARRGAP